MMRYLGGKSRIAKYLAPALNTAMSVVPCPTFWEPFVGAFNIVPALNLPSRAVVRCSDTHSGLIGMYLAATNGWKPPEDMTESQYYSLKEEEESPDRTWAAFAVSFGGKEWGGYARDVAGSRNLSAEGYLAFEKKIPCIKKCHFEHCAYGQIIPLPGDVVYCDPPYEGTQGYNTIFDNKRFQNWCISETVRGVVIFVSEFHNPLNWEVIWSKDRVTSVAKTGQVKSEMLLKVTI